MLSVINSGRVELLDNRRCIAQLIGLERRTTKLGKRFRFHTVPEANDDVINSVAGAVVNSITRTGIKISDADYQAIMRGSLLGGVRRAARVQADPNDPLEL